MKAVLSLVVAAFLAACFFSAPAGAENYLLNGGQASRINYSMVQEVKPKPTTRKLVLSFVVPKSFSSPTYSQKVESAQVLFSPEPTKREQFTDARGNQVVKATWSGQLSPVRTTVKLVAENSVNLTPIDTSEPFPLTDVPAGIKPYLAGTPMVDTQSPAIRAKARELTASAKTEFEAVQKIISWVADRMRYTLYPEAYDASYAFVTGRGNCQNYAHLSAALMRAAGIPVRIVTGITLAKPYMVTVGNTLLTMNMAEGRHAWIEVWFPDLGWMPFDPQNSALFVSNRFIRVETGVDNDEAIQDGLVLWSQVRGTDGQPEYTEFFNTGFLADDVKLRGKKTGYGPKAMVLYPEVAAAFGKVPAASEARPLTVAVAPADQGAPLTFGNLEFPENINFAAPPKEVHHGPGDTLEMRKSFLVETAEYVTANGRQYAQSFVVDKPLNLMEVGAALFKFGGSGEVWMELLQDDNGAPGKLIATSAMIDVEAMKRTPGYTWVDFDFSSAGLTLEPGAYWVALGFSGSPIINWFYSYGKPTGPENGTRFRSVFEETWPNILAHEFNYRVTGVNP